MKQTINALKSLKYQCACIACVCGLFVAGCGDKSAKLDTLESSVDSSVLESNTQEADKQEQDTASDTLESSHCGIKPPSHQAKLSFVGDNVLGDYKGASGATFNAKFQEIGGDYSYFSKGVISVLGDDDLSIGNMEGVLSDKNLKNAFEKPFSFKGASRYTNILKAASIQALNIANNHSRDYGKEGFNDTITHLREAGLVVFGEGIIDVYEVNGITFGFGGHRGWNLAIKPQVSKEIAELRAQGADIVIFTFHWGEEREHYPNATQKQLAYFSLDSGADMIIGHHPHVLQGVQTYKGKKIVYSLGNFIYGGAKNPPDKDSMIYQTRFLKFDSSNEAKEFATALESSPCLQELYLQGVFIDGVQRIDVLRNFVAIHNVVPVSISSTREYNDYAPLVYEADSLGFTRILKRLQTYSNLKP